MAGYINRGEEKSIVLKAADVDRLVHSGNGEAALLYLALMRTEGGITPLELMKKLQMTELQINAAENALKQMGLLPGEIKTVIPQTPERTVYTQEEIANLLENPEFSKMRENIQRELGKLSANDDQILANLYHDVGFPVDVIYLLVSHCQKRAQRRYGSNKRPPTMRQIEKEGYIWQSKGICDQLSAARYLKEYDRRIQAVADYMQVLQLGNRPPVESEVRYIMDWIEKGFPTETVALAYERTVLRKQGMDWRYLNGILRRWHEAGYHTVQEVEQGESSTPAQKKPVASDKSWMRSYTKR